jgi:LCP family protein required for cell wall assembly
MATEDGAQPPRTNTGVGESVTSSTVANSPAEREEAPAASASQTFEPVSILLLGGDAGPGRPGLRTDVIDVVTFIPATGRAALFGIPRNFGSAPLPDTLAGQYPGGVFDDLINALYEEVEAAPGAYSGSPNPGAEALEDTIGQLLGIDIEHHALVDMGGFVDVIDALGGVTIDVPAPIVVRLSPPKVGEGYRQYNIPIGVQQLDGHQAHAYVRSRTGSNDYDRMARQRCVLAALAEQVGALDLFTAVPRLADALEAHVSTDVPIDLLPALVRVAGNVNSSDVITLRFVPPDYTAGRDTRGQLIPDIAGIRAAVQSILSNLDDGSHPLTSGATAGTACAWDG